MVMTDEGKVGGTAGLSLPRCLEDFSEKCRLSEDEKKFVLSVGGILRSHHTRSNLRRFQKWTEEQPNRPDWARDSPSKLKNRLYGCLGKSATQIPDWPIVAWLIATSIQPGQERDDLEQVMASLHKQLTGKHPAGYVARSLLDEEPLTVATAPDIWTKAGLLSKQVDEQQVELIDARQQLADLSAAVAALENSKINSYPSNELAALHTRIAVLDKTIKKQHEDMQSLQERSRGRATKLEIVGARSANYLAVTAAWIDAYGLMNEDFSECVSLLNVNKIPEARVPRILVAPPQPTFRAVTRWVTVHLRAFLLSRYGHDIEAADIDDSTGQLTALINYGVLPSPAAVQPVLRAHELLRRFIPRLLDEAAAECRDRAQERSRFADTDVLDVVPSTPSRPQPNAQADISTGTQRPRGAAARPTEHDEVAAARARRIANAETVFIKVSELAQEDMTHPNAVDTVITRLRALELQTA